MVTGPKERIQVPPKSHLMNRFKEMPIALRVLRSALILGGIVLSGPRLSPAQHTLAKTRSASDRMYCYQKVLEPGAIGGGLVHVNGFTVEVKPIQADVPNFMICRATIRSAEGKIVFEHDEWGMEIDPITGKDVMEMAMPMRFLRVFQAGPTAAGRIT